MVCKITIARTCGNSFYPTYNYVRVHFQENIYPFLEGRTAQFTNPFPFALSKKPGLGSNQQEATVNARTRIENVTVASKSCGTSQKPCPRYKGALVLPPVIARCCVPTSSRMSEWLETEERKQLVHSNLPAWLSPRWLPGSPQSGRRRPRWSADACAVWGKAASALESSSSSLPASSWN